MNREWILKELRGAGRMEEKRGYVMIVCPFHADRNPSLSILLEDRISKGTTYPPGTFNCWSCDASGGWNKLAEKLGLKQITKKEISKKDPFFTFAKAFKEEHIELKVPKGLKPWPVTDEYRGLPGKFLNKIGAQRWWDSKAEAYRLFLDVTENDELCGYVGARLSDEVKLKYKNASGPWANLHWLGYDYERNKYLKKIWAKYNNEVVVIVEGPYDWLRCTYYKIPTLAILGNTLTETKCAALIALGVKVVVPFTDGDRQGIEYGRKLNIYLRDYVKVSSFKLPLKELKEDQLDPGNCSSKYYKRLKEKLEAYE